MDLQDFNRNMVSFEESKNSGVDALLDQAEQNPEQSERVLLKALSLDDTNISVFILLYRTYFQQDRWQDAAEVTERLLAVVAEKIQFPSRWQNVNLAYITSALSYSFGMVRLYFYVLKAHSVTQIRLGLFDCAQSMLEKIKELDPENRFGAQFYLDELRQRDVALGGSARGRSASGRVL